MGPTTAWAPPSRPGTVVQVSEPTSTRHCAGHTTSISERGSFCTARCTCGWYGPARRARSLARADAETHLAGGGLGHPGG